MPSPDALRGFCVPPSHWGNDVPAMFAPPTASEPPRGHGDCPVCQNVQWEPASFAVHRLLPLEADPECQKKFWPCKVFVGGLTCRIPPLLEATFGYPGVPSRWLYSLWYQKRRSHLVLLGNAVYGCNPLEGQMDYGKNSKAVHRWWNPCFGQAFMD